MPKKNMSRDDIIKWATSQLIALSADLDEDTAHDLAVYVKMQLVLFSKFYIKKSTYFL